MLVVMGVAALLVILCVSTHLVVLRALTALLPKLDILRRFRVGVVILGAIVGHLIEIAIFAVGINMLHHGERFGGITGEQSTTFADHFYFSAVTFTSLGFGDLTPTGPMRLLTAVEALTGLVLVAWTASFAFVAMQMFWRNQQPKDSDSNESTATIPKDS